MAINAVGVKILSIDIETSPNLAHVWSLWDQNVSLSQLIESTEMLCFAAKWRGSRKVEFYSSHWDGRDEMVLAAHRLMGEADVIMHYNGRRFDVPHLNREFLQAGLAPPAPYQQIDLLETVKRRFRFPSNKLEYVTRALGLEGKTSHEGHMLWVRCLAGDDAAWRTMRRYNIQDVRLLEKVYERLLPWIPNHPSLGARGSDDVCPACGSKNLVRQGRAYTSQSSYQRYRCGDCSKWSRGTRRIGATHIREVAL